MAGAETRTRIITSAEGIILRKSFHSVGLNEILAAAAVPKGSFYHYFESKDHFGVEMLRHYINEATESKTRLLSPTSGEPDPLLRLDQFLESSFSSSCDSGGKCPCLVLKLAAEVADLSEGMREVLADGMRTWLEILSSVFEEARSAGILTGEVDPLGEAEFIRDLWAGAVQRAAIAKSIQPVENALRFIRQRLASLSSAALPKP